MTKQQFDNVDRVFDLLHTPYVLDLISALGDDRFQRSDFTDRDALDEAMDYLHGIGAVDPQMSAQHDSAVRLTDFGRDVYVRLVEIENCMAHQPANHAPSAA